RGADEGHGQDEAAAKHAVLPGRSTRSLPAATGVIVSAGRLPSNALAGALTGQGGRRRRGGAAQALLPHRFARWNVFFPVTVLRLPNCIGPNRAQRPARPLLRRAQSSAGGGSPWNSRAVPARPPLAEKCWAWSARTRGVGTSIAIRPSRLTTRP